MVVELDGSIINCELWEDYWKSLVCTWGTTSSANNSAGCATLQGKLKKLVDAKVLCSAFFKEVLAEAKKFGLLTQVKNVNVIKLLNAVESTNPIMNDS